MPKFKVEVEPDDEIGWYPFLEVAEGLAASIAKTRGVRVRVYADVERAGRQHQWEPVWVYERDGSRGSAT